MIQSTKLKRRLDATTQRAKTGSVFYIVQADHPFVAEHLVHLCEYHLPNAFDISMWRRGSTRVQNAQNESAQ